MKHTFVILLLVISNKAALSQVKSSIDISAEINQSFRSIYGGNSPAFQSIVDPVEVPGRPMTNFALGIHYSQRIGEKFLFCAGLEYMRIGYQLNLSIGNINPITGEAIETTNQLNSINIRELFQYFSIPLNIRYQFGQTRLKPFIQAGPVLAFLTQARIRATINEEPPNTFDSSNFGGSYNDFNLFFQFQVGVNYQLSEKWQLSTSLGIRRSILSVVEAATSTQVHSSGITMGIRRIID
ncbi:MAG: outer membrane beta-barrel protein [Bacteroidota bacterium]